MEADTSDSVLQHQEGKKNRGYGYCNSGTLE